VSCMQSIQNPCKPGNVSGGRKVREQEYTKNVSTHLAGKCVAVGSERMKANHEYLADFNSVVGSMHNERRCRIAQGANDVQAGSIKLKQN